MIASAILAQLHELGVAVRPDGDVLRLRPAAAVPPDLQTGVKAHKAALLAMVAANDPPPVLPAACITAEARRRLVRGCHDRQAAGLLMQAWRGARGARKDAARPAVCC